MHGITKKAELSELLKRMKDLYPQDFNFFPKSWNVPSQLSRLKADLLEAKKKAQKQGLVAPTYIVKPSDTCQGRGIFFSSDVETIVKALHMTDGKIKQPKLDGLEPKKKSDEEKTLIPTQAISNSYVVQ